MVYRYLEYSNEKYCWEESLCGWWMFVTCDLRTPIIFRLPHHWWISYLGEYLLYILRGNTPSYLAVTCFLINRDGYFFIQESLCSRYVAKTRSSTLTIVTRSFTMTTQYHFVHYEQIDKSLHRLILFEVLW